MISNEAIFSPSKFKLSLKLKGAKRPINEVHERRRKIAIITASTRGHREGSNLKFRCLSKRLPRCNFPRGVFFSSDLKCADGTSIHRVPYKRYSISVIAAYKHNYEAEPNDDHLKKFLTSLFKKLDALCRFSRPHTVVGTVVGITSVSLLPIESMVDLSPIFFIELLKALLPAIFMNIYIVGLNQLFDVEIDKVNKPTLPLASGEFSREIGIVIVATCCTMSFFMGLKSQSPPLLCALLVSCFLGAAYSIDLPLLRWKQHAFLAAISILCVRAIIVQLAFFIHMQKYVLGRSATFTRSVVFATAFMCFFSAVIALFKDIPDVDGDRTFGIQSFSVRMGQERVFWLCIKLLLTAYVIAMIVGAFSTNIHQRLVTVLGHAMLASLLWFHAQSINIQNKASVQSFYMFIWKLFYAEYFLIPFIR